MALISAMNADGQCNYYDDVPLLLTRKIKAKYYQWPAPRYAQSADEYEMVRTNRLFRSVSGVAREDGRDFCRHWSAGHAKSDL